MKRMALLAAVAFGLAGCGMDPGTVSSPVPVKGRVTLANGQPVKDVILTLAPAETGKHAAGLKVAADGSFSGEAAAGTYTFYISAQEAKTAAEKQKYAAALNAVPALYREPHADRRIKVGSGDLDIKLN